jgi:hypothetical protein
VAIGVFMRSSTAEMTARAAGNVPIDWQVELVPGTSADGVAEAMRTAARIVRLSTVGLRCDRWIRGHGRWHRPGDRARQSTGDRSFVYQRLPWQCPPAPRHGRWDFDRPADSRQSSRRAR